jgi:hypothetical protein
MLTDVVGKFGFRWRTVGSVGVDRRDKLVFPGVMEDPAVYRFSIERANGKRAQYIGETANLRRRLGRYRNPSPGQQTNLRVCSDLRSYIYSRDHVYLDVVEAARFEIDGKEVDANLEWKNVRRMLEAFALVERFIAGEPAFEIEPLNK